MPQHYIIGSTTIPRTPSHHGNRLSRLALQRMPSLRGLFSNFGLCSYIPYDNPTPSSSFGSDKIFWFDACVILHNMNSTRESSIAEFDCLACSVFSYGGLYHPGRLSLFSLLFQQCSLLCPYLPHFSQYPSKRFCPFPLLLFCSPLFFLGQVLALCPFCLHTKHVPSNALKEVSFHLYLLHQLFWSDSLVSNVDSSPIPNVLR